MYVFGNADDTEVWIGSADLMHRNLDRRVEALVRLTSPDHVAELTQLIDLAFSDETAAWHLGPDGRWQRHHVTEDGTALRDLQEHLIRLKQRRRADGD